MISRLEKMEDRIISLKDEVQKLDDLQLKQ